MSQMLSSGGQPATSRTDQTDRQDRRQKTDRDIIFSCRNWIVIGCLRGGEVVGWFIIQFIPNFPHNLSASKFSKISTNTSSSIQPKVPGMKFIIQKKNR